QVGRLPGHDRVDVRQREAGVGERAVDRLPAQASDGHVGPPAAGMGLADPENGRPVPGHGRASITLTRFCCRAGPLVAWPRARSARPEEISRAAIPIRARPATNIGLAARAPPDGLTRTPSPRPSAPRSRIS